MSKVGQGGDLKLRESTVLLGNSMDTSKKSFENYMNESMIMPRTSMGAMGLAVSDQTLSQSIIFEQNR